jgi:hypothetical protein
MIKIAYICDRKRPCNMYGACGNECTHTFDEFHTANGIIHNIDELETDRFRKVYCVNEDTYYEEAEEWSNTIATDVEESEKNTSCSQ